MKKKIENRIIYYILDKYINNILSGASNITVFKFRQ